VGTEDNRLYAVKLKEKKTERLWSFLTGGDIAGRPLLHGDQLLFQSYDTYLYALEPENGHLAWRVHIGRRPRQEGILLEDRLLMAPLNTERLEVFSLPDGAREAPYSLQEDTERFVSAPVRAGNLIVIAAARYGESSSRIIGIASGKGRDHPEPAPSLPSSP
jgi:hypothetical protein